MKQLLTLALITGAPAALAQCELPTALAGRTFTNVVAPGYSPENPNAGNIVRLELGQSTYRLHILHLGQIVQGTYGYQRLADNIGQLSMLEAFGGETTRYNLTLVCLSPRTGTFVYTQERGAIKPDIRQNTGRYTLQD